MPPMSVPGSVGAPLMAAINELQGLGLQGVHGAVFAGTPAGSIGAWRDHLLSQSSRTVDKLTIEIVGMMFDHMLRDQQVPSEIKALLSRLQFPVLKAALMAAEERGLEVAMLRLDDLRIPVGPATGPEEPADDGPWFWNTRT